MSDIMIGEILLIAYGFGAGVMWVNPDARKLPNWFRLFFVVTWPAVLAVTWLIHEQGSNDE